MKSPIYVVRNIPSLVILLKISFVALYKKLLDQNILWELLKFGVSEASCAMLI